MANQHRWSFFRAGGFDQVKLETGADLMNLDRSTRSCGSRSPVPRGPRVRRAHARADRHRQGRAHPRARADRRGEVGRRDAQESRRPPEGRSVRCRSSAINDATPEGAELLASAQPDPRQRRQAGRDADLGRATRPTRSKIFAGSAFNGDGVITPNVRGATSRPGRSSTTSSPASGSAARQVGQAGRQRREVDAFFAEVRGLRRLVGDGRRPAAARLARWARPRRRRPSRRSRPCAPKVDDYFARCRLAAFDAARACRRSTARRRSTSRWPRRT